MPTAPDLQGKVAVVTGASRGLGQRIAVRLAHRGATVALLARGKPGLEDTRQLIAAMGASSAAEARARALVLPLDLTQPDAIAEAKGAIERELGTPSILINAAGIFGPISLIQDSDAAAWIQTITVNMVTSYLTCRAFVGAMIGSGWGRIVNVTSAAALHPPGPLNSAYGTSKAALNHFTRHLASELQGTGVTANVIHPGDVKTEMWAEIMAESKKMGSVADGFVKWAEWVQETGGDDPEKAADLVEYLLSDDAAEVNGRFLWIADGLQSPIPSWGDADDLRPWVK